MKRLDALFDERGDLRGVCLFRIFAGPLAIAHLWPYCRLALHGHYYRDGFYVPWFAHYPEPSLHVYAALLALGVVSAAALSVGLWTRVTSRVCFGVVAYHFFLSETFFHHNRAFLLIFLGGLALCPCADQLTLFPPNKPQLQRLLWPLYLWRAEACVPYLASSTSKLLDPEWFAGIVTWDRVERYRHLAEGRVPSALLDLASSPALHAVLAKATIALELTVGLGLWFARTRYLAVWLAVVFHVLVQLSAEIQVFSVLGVCGLAIWTTPRARDRRVLLRLDTPVGQRWRRRLHYLDWLARFESLAADGGDDLTLIERDGTRYTGRAARLHLFARLPLTAFFALPLLGFELNRSETPAGSDPDRRPTSS